MPLQVFAEFIQRIRHSGSSRWATADAHRAFVEAWRQAAVGSDAYTEARSRRRRTWRIATHHVPIWDALIWAVCDRAGARILATEDFQDGRTLGRVTFLDPFNPKNAARLGLA